MDMRVFTTFFCFKKSNGVQQLNNTRGQNPCLVSAYLRECSVASSTMRTNLLHKNKLVRQMVETGMFPHCFLVNRTPVRGVFVFRGLVLKACFQVPGPRTPTIVVAVP